MPDLSAYPSVEEARDIINAYSNSTNSRSCDFNSVPALRGYDNSRVAEHRLTLGVSSDSSANSTQARDRIRYLVAVTSVLSVMMYATPEPIRLMADPFQSFPEAEKELLIRMAKTTNHLATSNNGDSSLDRRIITFLLALRGFDNAVPLARAITLQSLFSTPPVSTGDFLHRVRSITSAMGDCMQHGVLSRSWPNNDDPTSTDPLQSLFFVRSIGSTISNTYQLMCQDQGGSTRNLTSGGSLLDNAGRRPDSQWLRPGTIDECALMWMSTTSDHVGAIVREIMASRRDSDWAGMDNALDKYAIALDNIAYMQELFPTGMPVPSTDVPNPDEIPSTTDYCPPTSITIPSGSGWRTFDSGTTISAYLRQEETSSEGATHDPSQDVQMDEPF